MDVQQHPVTVEKKVTFASDVKSDSSTSRTPSVVPESSRIKAVEPMDGLIGRLEVYKSGAVKMRLANGILLDVRYISQSFAIANPIARSTVVHNLHSCNTLSILTRRRNDWSYLVKSISNL